MPLRYCSRLQCSAAASRDCGSCVICSKHFCIKHVKSNDHLCPPNEDDDGATAASIAAEKRHIIGLLESVDGVALATIASGIRGIACKIPALEETDYSTCYDLASGQMGGQNCNLDVVFSDGIVWIARIRLSNHPRLLPQQVQDYILRSEVATLKYLANTKVPAPKVFAFDCAPNDVGVSFCLVEKLEGSPLHPGWPPEGATSRKCTNLLSQLADIYIELASNKFRATGSLVPTRTRGGTEVGGFSDAQFFDNPDGPPLGPFTSTTAAMRAESLLQLKMITAGEKTDLPLQNYIRHLWRLEVLSSQNTLPISDPETSFFIRHRDDKGDHILVDSDFNITGVLDWEFASIEHPSIAFSSPCMLWPIGEFYNGSQTLSSAEHEFAQILESKGYPKLSEYVLSGRLMQRLDFEMIEYPPTEDDFESLLQGARKAYAIATIGSEDVSTYAVWKETMLKKYANDDGLRQLLRHQVAVPVSG